MNIFYVDNFRGFPETFLQLGDVNFLVGENSSGKTSILNLITLMSKNKFWYTFEFATDDFDFGTFDEICSVGSGNRSFTVGFYSEKTHQKISRYMHLLTFVSRGGQPVISEQVILENDFMLVAKIDGDSVKYKKIEVEIDKNGLESFEFLLRYYREYLKGKRLTKIPIDEDDAFSSLSFVVKIADNEVEKRIANFIPTAFLNTAQMLNIAPIRAKPQGFYTTRSLTFSSEGEHTPSLLKSMLEMAKKSPNKETGVATKVDYISSFGRESNMFDEVSVEKYGKKANAPFEVDVIRNLKKYKINHVGYGVSQILPVLVEATFSSEGDWVSIQQPEVHLHPRAQAAAGELFFKLASAEKISFLIETHSDFLIDRYRLLQSRSEIPVSTKILFFERRDVGNTIVEIVIDKDGKYPEDLPDCYREFFLSEAYETMGI